VLISVGHLSTRDATKPLLFDHPYDEFQNINTLEDFVEDELLENTAEEEEKLMGNLVAENELLEEIAEGELLEDIMEDEQDIAEGELLDDDGTAGENEHDDESQNGSECLEEEAFDYDDL
jgi:hypothetical protein